MPVDSQLNVVKLFGSRRGSNSKAVLLAKLTTVTLVSHLLLKEPPKALLPRRANSKKK